MEDHQNSSDHLSSSLTDLMTSLMVIFILLLLVFVQRSAGRDAAVADVLLAQLRDEMKPMGFSKETIRQDPRDRNAILVVVPNRLMNFEVGRSALRPDGVKFLEQYVPHLAGTLCSGAFRSSVESVVVEGHTDSQLFVGGSAEDSRNLNLKLSQDRSMEVVKSLLANLAGMPAERACFLEKLSASGRGDQDPEATPDASRRVIFKVRVKVKDADPVQRGVLVR
jgi:chemotaxis protein MotB